MASDQAVCPKCGHIAMVSSTGYFTCMNCIRSDPRYYLFK